MAILIVSTAMRASGQSNTAQISHNAPTNTTAREREKPRAKQSSASESTSAGSALQSSDQHVNTFRTAPKHFLLDQKAMWTSPAHIRLPDATWLVPLGGFAATLFATDTDASRHLNNAPNTLSHYRKFSNYGVGAMVGAAGGAYFLGLATHNGHQKETGFLSGEAAVDSVVAAEALKYITGRERPLVDDARGEFRQGGVSFPSVHSAAAWSIAGIVAHEYPGILPKVAAYGLATAISASRVTSKEHFPSDALVGSAIGFLVSQYVYREHHDPDLPGGGWSLLGIRPERPGHWQARDIGSPYVPLDSWIYPALLRLAALGFIKSDFEGMRPWTRMECARLVEEADENVGDNPDAGREATQLDSALQKEFSREIALLGGGNNAAAQLESVYTRVTGISGAPLTDGYHFGQTIVNDYGRPYEQGFNNVTGFSGWASEGPFVGYVSGEYQHAPSAPAVPLAARQVISRVDELNAVPPPIPTSSIDQFKLLDSYVGMTVDDIEVSFGKQSLWWGPGEGGPLMLSDNAEPVDMVRITNVRPFKLPSILGLLGPVRAEFFVGRLTGQEFVFGVPTGVLGQFTQPLSDQPFIDGGKLTIKPTANLEFSISKTGIFGGPGVPVTWRSFLRSVFSRSNSPPGTPNDPGDRRTGADLTYRPPILHHWLTVYADAFSEDEISPLAYPRKSAMQGGIYVPKLPGLNKFDFRAEGGFTEPPGFWNCQGCFYFNDRFLDGLTNRGNLMASWLGRAGEGEQLWSTYWKNAYDSVKFGYRHSKVAPDFIPGGGTLTDTSIELNWRVSSAWRVSSSIQYEKWNIPVLATEPQSNWTTSVEVGFWPKSWSK